MVYVFIASVSSDMDHQVKSLLRCSKFLCRLFKQNTPIPAPGFDSFTLNGSQTVFAKAATVFKVSHLLHYCDWCWINVTFYCIIVHLISWYILCDILYNSDNLSDYWWYILCDILYNTCSDNLSDYWWYILCDILYNSDNLSDYWWYILCDILYNSDNLSDYWWYILCDILYNSDNLSDYWWYILCDLLYNSLSDYWRYILCDILYNSDNLSDYWWYILCDILYNSDNLSDYWWYIFYSNTDRSSHLIKLNIPISSPNTEP